MSIQQSDVKFFRGGDDGKPDPNGKNWVAVGTVNGHEHTYFDRVMPADTDVPALFKARTMTALQRRERGGL